MYPMITENEMRERMREDLDYLEWPLHSCALDDDVYGLRQLLIFSRAADLERQHETWGTALHAAVLSNNLASVTVLLDAGANSFSNMLDGSPSSALILSIQHGRRDILRYIWDCIPSEWFSASTWLSSCFIQAARSGQIPVLEDLLDLWEGWSSQDKDNALRHAAIEWQFWVADFLLGRFVYSPDALSEALHQAIKVNAQNGPPDTRYTGADYLQLQRLIARLVDEGADPNACHGGLPLIIQAAIEVNLLGALQVLLEKGANPDATDKDGRSALHRVGSPIRASSNMCKSLHETGIRLLIEHGGDVCLRDTEGNTPLHCAAFGSNLYIFRLYLSRLSEEDQHTAITTTENDHGEALLHWAAAGGKMDIVEYILSHNVDASKSNTNGWTPLIGALAPVKDSEKGPREAIRTARVLLEYGADPLDSSAEGWTPLHCLAMHTDSDQSGNIARFSEELITHGADVEARAAMLVPGFSLHRYGSDGYDYSWGFRLRELIQSIQSLPGTVKSDLTPLQWAAAYGAVGVVRALLAYGVDSSLGDESGNSPARLAIESRRLQLRSIVRNQLIQLLIEAGGGI